MYGQRQALNVRWASASMCGWRQTNEDSHITELINLPDGRQALLAGVFDGHGGSDVSTYVAKNIKQHFLESQNFPLKKYCKALSEAFLSLDE